MASTATSRPPNNAAGSNAAASSSNSSAPSTSKPTSTASTSPSAQQPQVSLLGTLPIHLVPALLRRIESNLVTLPPTLLCEKETVLARHDDETSAVRETGDNAWASVVKARKGVKLRVREAVKRSNDGKDGVVGGSESVECTLCLPLPSLPERQYPKASVRPSYNVELLSDTAVAPGQNIGRDDPFRSTVEDTLLGFDPATYLNTDIVNGWKSFVSSIGWRPHFAFLRYGLSFALNEILSRSSSTARPTLLNPSHGTKHTLNVYRIFTPDPSGYTDEWTPLDPEGATVVVELTATVGGELDQSLFNRYCSPAEVGAATQADGGLDPPSTIENAVDFADSAARSLRGLVDLKREAYD
ncbi:acetyl CoA carboxylase [Pseudozyma hubeiensis SY62]|uniref:Acetyl CoA carboxylase n=1 Tax=Pseudozyma hubeiensis (strain SY62) TaxID=1305764 RepID=R9NYI9_PSEHS|nr:acetyl CoA carboxylase [Pseudozyma hubeiensis SY62]GAC93828.1 acetyl CoA carboxylase [Pseudozyma hubeiensis SY62]